MSVYLTVQHTYENVEAGLFNRQHCIDTITIHKHDASSLLTESIKKLLHSHDVNLTTLAFLAINQGPGPFTTLRVVISTMNGLSFAVGTPMIGIDGIITLALEHRQSNKINIALLNAFNQDVYFAVETKTNPVQTGYDNIEHLLGLFATQYADRPLHFFGNGALLHADNIKRYCPNATIDNSASHCSLEAIAQQAYAKWERKEFSKTQLQPLYLKSIAYSNSIKVK